MVFLCSTNQRFDCEDCNFQLSVTNIYNVLCSKNLFSLLFYQLGVIYSLPVIFDLEFLLPDLENSASHVASETVQRTPTTEVAASPISKVT